MAPSGVTAALYRSVLIFGVDTSPAYPHCGQMSPCEIWTRTKTDSTPIMYVKGRRVAAHRWVWIQAHGEIPPTTVIKHKCGDCFCVNLDHLYALDRTDPKAVFLDKTKPGSHRCVLWTGARNKGTQAPAAILNGRTQAAYRVAWQLWCGPIPEGAQVRRRCGNTDCVAIDHLFLHFPGV